LFISLFICYLLSLSSLYYLLLSSLIVTLSFFFYSCNSCDDLIPSKLTLPFLYPCMHFFAVDVCLSMCFQSQ
jgi:hypothetical protein